MATFKDVQNKERGKSMAKRQVKKETENKLSNIDSKSSVLKNLNKRFGNDLNARWLGETQNEKLPSIPTGIATIDDITGIGGIPKGGLIEIIGENATGKTALASSIIAEAQALGESCFFIDMEQAYDLKRAKQLGVDINELGFVQPDDGNQAIEIAREVCNSGEFTIVVVDSVATLVPRSELEGVSGDANMGAHARLMSAACRVLSPVVKKNDILFIFINQYRKKMVTMGDPRVPTGGESLKFYAKMRIETTTPDKIEENKEIVGRRNKVKIIKNKVGAPFRTAEYDIYYDKRGIDKVGSIVPVAVKYGVMGQSGTWFSYKDENIGQGLKKTSEYLVKNPLIYEEIKLSIEEKRQTFQSDKFDEEIEIPANIDLETGEILDDAIMDAEIIEQDQNDNTEIDDVGEDDPN